MTVLIADIFPASLLIKYCSFSSIIIIIDCHDYILSIRFFLKCKGLSNARVASATKKEYGFVKHFFVKIHKVIKVNIR